MGVVRPLAALVAAGIALGAPAVASADPPLLYLTEGPAAVINDGLGGPTLRQSPSVPNPRWPAARVVGRVSGRDIAGYGPRRIIRALRAGLAEPGVGGLVSVDEMVPNQWSPVRIRALRIALRILGPNAKRVIFYASPAFVARVGRAHPGRPLPRRLRLLVDAVSRGRATYLQTYRGDLTPLPPRQMATHLTRWRQRWPHGPRRGELRVIAGAARGTTESALWTSMRSTPAGRSLLASGPGAYGLNTRAEAAEWLAQYRAFLADPTHSPTGRDYPVPRGGGLRLSATGRRVRVDILRPGRAVVSMRRRGERRVRALRKLRGPTRGVVTIRLPRSRPGIYRVKAVLYGNGLRDAAAVNVRVR